MDAAHRGGGMSAAPIMVRVAITPEEWTAVRRLALDRNTSSKELIADAIRSHLLNGGKAK